MVPQRRPAQLAPGVAAAKAGRTHSKTNGLAIARTRSNPDKTIIEIARRRAGLPRVIVFQSPNLAHFLEELLELGNPSGPRSEIDLVHEDHAMRVWTENPGMLGFEECLGSGDPVLEAFAESLPERFEVKDLRGAAVGDGFSWGRYGPRTENRRAGEARVLAYERRSRGQRFKDWLGWGGS